MSLSHLAACESYVCQTEEDVCEDMPSQKGYGGALQDWNVIIMYIYIKFFS